MQVANKICGSLILGAYIVFGLIGIALESALTKHTRGIENPIQEDSISTQNGKRLFRWDALWRRSRVPVWLAIPILIWLLCGRCA